MKELICKFLSKIFSGRYFTTVVIVGTACKAYLGCMDLVTMGKMNIEVFLGINTGFWTIVGSIITFYFTRTDRKTQQEDK